MGDKPSKESESVEAVAVEDRTEVVTLVVEDELDNPQILRQKSEVVISIEKENVISIVEEESEVVSSITDDKNKVVRSSIVEEPVVGSTELPWYKLYSAHFHLLLTGEDLLKRSKVSYQVQETQEGDQFVNGSVHNIAKSNKEVEQIDTAALVIDDEVISNNSVDNEKVQSQEPEMQIQDGSVTHVPSTNLTITEDGDDGADAVCDETIEMESSSEGDAWVYVTKNDAENSIAQESKDEVTMGEAHLTKNQLTDKEGISFSQDEFMKIVAIDTKSSETAEEEMINAELVEEVESAMDGPMADIFGTNLLPEMKPTGANDQLRKISTLKIALNKSPRSSMTDFAEPLCVEIPVCEVESTDRIFLADDETKFAKDEDDVEDGPVSVRECISFFEAKSTGTPTVGRSPIASPRISPLPSPRTTLQLDTMRESAPQVIKLAIDLSGPEDSFSSEAVDTDDIQSFKEAERTTAEAVIELTDSGKLLNVSSENPQKEGVETNLVVKDESEVVSDENASVSSACKIDTEGLIEDQCESRIMKSASDIKEVIKALDRPTTVVSITDEPTKEVSVSEPTTEVLVFDEPMTEVSVTEEPTNEASVTDETVSEVSVAEKATIEVSAVKGTITEVSGTDEPSTEVSVTEEAKNEVPVTEETPAEVSVTDEQTTEVSVIDEETTEISVTEKPITEFFVTEERTTEVSVTEEPTTEVSVTNEQITEVSINDEPTTEVTVTNEQIAEVSVNDESTTEVSVTDEQIAEVSVNDEPTTEVSLTDEQIAEVSVNDEPTTEVSLTDEQIAEVSVNDEPTTEVTVTDEQIAEVSVNDEPTTEVSLTDEQIAEVSVNDESTTEVLVTDEQIAEVSVNDEPTTEVSLTDEQIAEVSVNDEPTTEVSVTDEQINKVSKAEQLTTEVSATDEEITELSVTEEPTTEVWVTDEQITEISVTEEPATKVLVTDEPTNVVSVTGETTTEVLITDVPSDDVSDNDETKTEMSVSEKAPPKSTITEHITIKATVTVEVPSEALVNREILTETSAIEEVPDKSPITEKVMDSEIEAAMTESVMTDVSIPRETSIGAASHENTNENSLIKVEIIPPTPTADTYSLQLDANTIQFDSATAALLASPPVETEEAINEAESGIAQIENEPRDRLEEDDEKMVSFDGEGVACGNMTAFDDDNGIEEEEIGVLLTLQEEICDLLTIQRDIARLKHD